MPKLKIKKNDTVRVISGNSRNSEGKVLSIDTKKMRAIVEGVNIISKHAKPSAKNKDGGIEKTEGSIHISNLMLIESGKPVRVGRKKDEKSGKIVRVSKKTKELVK